LSLAAIFIASGCSVARVLVTRLAPWLAVFCLCVTVVAFNARRWFDVSPEQLVWRSIASRSLPIQDRPGGMVNLVADGDVLKVSGEPAYVAYDLISTGNETANIDYLAFEFECIEQRSSPAVRFLWWSDRQAAPVASQGLNMMARGGINVVATRDLPGWHDASRVKGILMQLSNPTACASVWMGPLLAARSVG
jgi:hypothetical protein